MAVESRGDLASRHGSIGRIARAHSWSYRSDNPICTRTDKGYTIDHLIYSPYERRYNDQSVTIKEWSEFNEYRDYFKKMGTKLHNPYREQSFAKPWWETNGVSFNMIGPAKSIATNNARELHDACLVIKAIMGERKCLFTGDASDSNLKYIADNTKNCCDDILHASHHGSINGANLDFIKKCKAG